MKSHKEPVTFFFSSSVSLPFYSIFFLLHSCSTYCSFISFYSNFEQSGKECLKYQFWTKKRNLFLILAIFVSLSPCPTLPHFSDTTRPSYRVVSLAGLVHTLPLQADASLPAGRSLHGRQLLGQAHHLSLSNYGAPQPRTYVHAWADRVLGAEGQATLADGVVALPWELLGTQQGLARRVQEALGWNKEEGILKKHYATCILFTGAWCMDLFWSIDKWGLNLPLRMLLLHELCRKQQLTMLYVCQEWNYLKKWERKVWLMLISCQWSVFGCNVLRS